METEESELIATLLSNISDVYESTDNLNVEYVRKRTLEYYQKRELELTIEKVKTYITQNEPELAEQAILHFKKISLSTSECVDIFDEEQIQKAFAETEESLFYIPGYLGFFLGPLQRGWLVGLEGG